MTVGELIAMLKEQDRNAPVRLMSQPNYPFEYSIGGMWVGTCKDDGLYDEPEDDSKAEQAVYILEGQQLGYGRRRAWQESEY
jgi:hypothetical protein